MARKITDIASKRSKLHFNTLDTVLKCNLDPDYLYDMLSEQALIEITNNILSQFKRRGIKIIDWDHKDKSVKEVRRIGSQIYFLVTGDDDE